MAVTLVFGRELHVVAEVFAQVEVGVCGCGEGMPLKFYGGKREDAVAFMEQSPSVVSQVLGEVAVFGFHEACDAPHCSENGAARSEPEEFGKGT